MIAHLAHSMDVLVIDVGGSHVKPCATNRDASRFPSGPAFTATALVEEVRAWGVSELIDRVIAGELDDLARTVPSGALSSQLPPR